MKYMGSKNRISKYLLPIILNNRKENQYYIEPFVGGCNLIDKVNGNRIGSDSNKYLIAMWNKVSKGWIPPKYITEKQYNFIKKHKDLFPHLTGYIGFALSYGGKFFGGWCRDSLGIRNYVDEAYRNAINQFPKLQKVKFYNCNYNELPIPENSMIYCDPPYQNTTKYNKYDFDYDKFWDWCREKSITNNVFVSEYNAPVDFECIWEKEVNSSLTKNTGSKKNIEKLFKFRYLK